MRIKRMKPSGINRVRHTIAQRLGKVQAMLVCTTRGLQTSQIARELSVCERTVRRCVKALEASGVPIHEERDGRRKLLRIISDHGPPLSFGRRELLTLESARRVMQSFHGTGMDIDMDNVLEKVRARLNERELAVLDRYASKIRYVDDAAYEYGDREEAYSEIVTATIAEERLKMRHVAVARGKTTFRVDPYALLIYRKGLYIVGFSHHHQGVRTFGLDGTLRVRWLRKQSFVLPPDFDVEQIRAGAFGLIVGATTDVRLRFDRSVARYVRRRRWHPSQRFVESDVGLEMNLRVDGTRELLSWILGFGSKVEVLAPAVLRGELQREHRRCLDRYDIELPQTTP